jgi:hypothetical protein
VEAAGDGEVVAVADRLTRAEYVRRLLDLGRRHGEIPIYGSPEWEALDSIDPRRFAAVVRAAECWRLDSEPDAVRRRIAEDDLLAAVRIRLMSHDLSEIDWSRILEVNRARRESGDFRYRKAVA